MILAGLLSFHATRAYLNSTWHPCQSLPNDKQQQSESPQATGAANTTISRNDTLLLQQYQQTQTLLTLLNSATPAQKLRLNQQLRILTHGIDSFCRLSNQFQSDQAGLLLVSTWSASLSALLIIRMTPNGLHSSNRTEQTIFISTSFLLVICISILSFIDPSKNIINALTGYRDYNNLLQGFSSSLANQQLLLIPAQRGSSQALGQPLTSAAMVANLIGNLDTILQTIPDPTLSLNDSFAQGTFNRMIGGADNALQNNPPVGSSNPAPATSQAATESQNPIKTAIPAHTNPP